MVIIILSTTGLIFLRTSRYFYAAPVGHNPMVLQLACEKRSDGLGYAIRISDVVEVEFKHYGIAVDIYSYTDSILKATLATMNRGDEITLITFGDHLESQHFTMDDGYQEIVQNMLRRHENGCNVGSALHELDRTVCDERILISNGKYDDGELKVTLKNQVRIISPGESALPDIEMPSEPVQLILRNSDHICNRREIRTLLEKPRPNFFNIKLEAEQTHYIPPIAFGGTSTIHLPNFEGKINLSYFDAQGNSHNAEIETE